jgi:hypothetical protein
MSLRGQSDFCSSEGMYGCIEQGLEESVRFYEAWNAEVVRTVPEDRLLVLILPKSYKYL